MELSDDLDKVFLRSDPGDIHIHKEALLDNDKLQKIADSLHRQLVIILNLVLFSFFKPNFCLLLFFFRV